VLSEVEAIDLILKIVSLLEILHEKHLIHSNLCPKEIFLKNKDLNQMSFMNLYHAIWDTQSVLGMNIPGVQETMTKMDIRTREAAYLSPE